MNRSSRSPYRNAWKSCMGIFSIRKKRRRRSSTTPTTHMTLLSGRLSCDALARWAGSHARPPVSLLRCYIQWLQSACCQPPPTSFPVHRSCMLDQYSMVSCLGSHLSDIVPSSVLRYQTAISAGPSRAFGLWARRAMPSLRRPSSCTLGQLSRKSSCVP